MNMGRPFTIHPVEFAPLRIRLIYIESKKRIIDKEVREAKHTTQTHLSLAVIRNIKVDEKSASCSPLELRSLYSAKNTYYIMKNRK